MNCPACLSQNSIKWTFTAYVCRLCGHEVTQREYEIELRGRYDDWLSEAPEQVFDDETCEVEIDR